MADQFMQTIVPWLLGGLAILAFLSLSLTVRAWRESKRSPYYFLRRQAEQQMQTYSLVSLGLAIVILFVGSYAWQGPQDNTPRVVLMANAKPRPVQTETTPIVTRQLETADRTPDVAQEAPEVVTIRGTSMAEVTLSLARQEDTALPAGTAETPLAEQPDLEEAAAVSEKTLPPEFDELEPTVELGGETNISALTFSTDVSDDLAALGAGRLFDAGYYTIYATFDYTAMEDGMVWSWVWRRDGQVISGGHERWNYGDEGPGYVYLNPIEGFQPGEYTLEVWVNGELFSEANMFVANDAAANN